MSDDYPATTTQLDAPDRRECCAKCGEPYTEQDRQVVRRWPAGDSVHQACAAPDEMPPSGTESKP